MMNAGKRPALRKYTPAQRAAALTALAMASNDYAQVAADLGIPEGTLRRWSARDKRGPADPAAQRTIAEAIEAALHEVLKHIPTIKEPKDWGVVVGILADKYLLLRGQPTQISQTLEGWASDPDVIAEAERILAESASRGAGAGGTPAE